MKYFFIFMFLCSTSTAAIASDIEDKAREFIYNQQKTITDTLLINDKKEKFEKLYSEIDKTFATDRIYKFALGRFAKLFNNEQKSIIIDYFKKLILITYGIESDINIKNLSLEITQSESSKKPDGSHEILLEGFVKNKEQINLLNVSFVIMYENKEFRIYNIIIENLGLLITFRNMFSNMMQENYNEPDLLIKTIQDQISKINQEIYNIPEPEKEVYILQ